jgi:Ser/Thr protein kinase RdoA (MazF antagonist)
VDAAEGRYVARVHRLHLTPERLAAIHKARTALRAGGVPCAQPLPTLDGTPWITLKGRLVEVEPYVDHDAVMDTWERLATGMPVLARAHNLLGRLEAGEAGRRPRFANHLEPAEVSPAVRRGTERIRAWGPTSAERRLAAVADELAELVTEAEAGLGSRLPRQLVDGYDAGLDLPLSAAERAALPVAMARQALSSIGGWVARLDDEAVARRHAASAGPELVAARRLLAELDRWRHAFAR